MSIERELLKQAIDVIEGLFYGSEQFDRKDAIFTVEKIELYLANHEKESIRVYAFKPNPDDITVDDGYPIVAHNSEHNPPFNATLILDEGVKL